MRQPTVSVIIPTLNAEDEIGQLLSLLERQTLTPTEILVVDSSSDDNTAAEVKKHSSASLIVIDRSSFNHGGTRDLAFRKTTGEIVCFLTQDAIPESFEYLERLIRPILDNKEVVLSSGRQLPKSDARRFEQLVRSFNYPDIASVRGKEDLSAYGIKTFLPQMCAPPIVARHTLRAVVFLRSQQMKIC